MRLRLLLLWLVLAPAISAAATWQERADWARFFTDAGVEGTIAVVDHRKSSHWVYGKARADTRYIPASTFKIPHPLFALDADIVRDEFQVFPWDGVRRDIVSWNRDQDLRSSMRGSVVWVFQAFARAIGEEGEQRYLSRIDYGNANPSGGIDRFWLDGKLAISAFEQLDFLQRLYRNQLPFQIEHQRLVKDILILEAEPDWILRGKTGWLTRTDPQLGWWVGWVELPDGPVFFALNIDMPKGRADLPKREAIGAAILRSIQALPSEVPIDLAR